MYLCNWLFFWRSAAAFQKLNEKANLNIHISLPTYLFNSTMFKDDCRERNHIVWNFDSGHDFSCHLKSGSIFYWQNSLRSQGRLSKIYDRDGNTIQRFIWTQGVWNDVLLPNSASHCFTGSAFLEGMAWMILKMPSRSAACVLRR